VTDAFLSDGVDLSIFDKTISSGFRALKFPRRLEAAFERETGPLRCRNLTIGAFFGIAVYDLFLVADWWVTPDIFATALWLRLAFVTPLAFAMTMALTWRPPVFACELLATAGTMLAAATQLYLMILSRSLVQGSQNQAVVLIILYITMVQRVRFWYAAPACLGALALQSQLADRADCVFRFGGEEFLILLRANDLTTGLAIAEALRRAIEEAAIPNPALPGKAVVTASFGVACARIGEGMGTAEIIASRHRALRGQTPWPQPGLAALSRRREIADLADPAPPAAEAMGQLQALRRNAPI
jgi:hypothetical protein